MNCGKEKDPTFLILNLSDVNVVSLTLRIRLESLIGKLIKESFLDIHLCYYYLNRPMLIANIFFYFSSKTSSSPFSDLDF